MRNRIIMAAFEEIELRGFKFTMSDLTKRLNVSKTSLYEHFSSKSELIGVMLEMAIRETEEYEDQIYKNPSLSLAEKFQAILTAGSKRFGPLSDRIYDGLFNHYPKEWQKIANYREKRLNRLSELLAGGMDNQMIRPVHLAVVRQMLTGAMSHLIKNSFLTENNMTYQDAVANMADVVMYGLYRRE